MKSKLKMQSLKISRLVSQNIHLNKQKRFHFGVQNCEWINTGCMWFWIQKEQKRHLHQMRHCR